MLGLDVIEVMTPSGHPSIINKIFHRQLCLFLLFHNELFHILKKYSTLISHTTLQLNDFKKVFFTTISFKDLIQMCTKICHFSQ